ncbi:MAG: hypothetical protein MUD01_20120 [Chloroflexaceae bacterium]|nr:hypothetical protein [Chloroflexaceae bacterium]
MNLGYVFIFFGLLLILGIALPGLLLAWRLLLPTTVARAHQRLEQTPGRCLLFGLLLTLPALVVLGVLLALPGVFQLLGWLGLLLLFTAASVGAAGLADLMSSRFPSMAGGRVGPGAMVRSAVALELAVIFPFIGWFVLLPLLTLATLGAATFALLGWGPRPRAIAAVEVHHAVYPS